MYASLCVKNKVKIESLVLKTQQRRFVCIAGVMAASLCAVSSQSSLARIFDNEMLQNLYIMNDMVQEMYEDKKERNIIREKLIKMKEEKQELLENMNEMETQLHLANENLEMMHDMEDRKSVV